ncbi:MAG TPA: hypothetical protein VGS98_10540 [Thermoanaerobaculia bacterium]|nr:hypothetical protein [Thermoanaerobaculia bacterium]
MSSGSPPTLEEARERLRRLGYLQGRVERFVFRRALADASGLVVPVLGALVIAIALAETAAVASSQFRYGGSPRAVVLLFLELAFVALVPALLFAALATAAASRSRRPGRDGAHLALLAAGGVLVVWLVGTWRLGPERAAPALLWGIPVAAAALLAGATTRTAFLARAFARSGRLPERPRRAVLLFAAAVSLSIAAIVVATRREPARAATPLPSPREVPLVVVGIDGLALDILHEAGENAIAGLLSRGSTGWWRGRAASPAEIWTDLATGVPAPRHGVRALEWVRPWGLPALRPPFGTAWYFRGLGLAAGTVERAPVSAWERRNLTFWEVAASAGLPSLAVGWWASGAWPGADVVENREVLARASGGLEADAVAIADFERRARGRSLAAVYLPGADILREDPAARRAALARLWRMLDRLIVRARNGEIVLAVIAADSHPSPASRGRLVVFDGRSPARSALIQPFDVAPSLLARAGVPAARDLAGRPATSLFPPGTLETTTVETYGDRIAPAAERRRETDREYLEKLKSLGYLN